MSILLENLTNQKKLHQEREGGAPRFLLLLYGVEGVRFVQLPSKQELTDLPYRTVESPFRLFLQFSRLFTSSKRDQLY